jgi:hypothetical protein
VDELFRLALTNAAWATALALAATAGAWLWRSRPALVHVLWLLVLIKLVTPSLTRVGVLPVRAPAAPSAVAAGGRSESPAPESVIADSNPDARASSPSPSPRRGVPHRFGDVAGE